MESLANTTARSKYATVLGAGSLSATLTVAADADQIHVLDWMTLSVDAAPALTAKVTVTIGGTDLFDIDMKSIHEKFRFPVPIHRSAKNESLVVTMGPSGLSRKNRITIGYR